MSVKSVDPERLHGELAVVRAQWVTADSYDLSNKAET
jgi:hypothetical protein